MSTFLNMTWGGYRSIEVKFFELLSKLKSIRFQAKPYLSNFVSIPTFCLSWSTCDICKQPVSQSKCSICKATCLSIYMWHLQATRLSIFMWLWPPHLQATCLSSSTSDGNLISILQATHLSRSMCDCNNLQSAADHSDACTKHAPQNQSSQGLLNWNPATTSSRLKPGASAITCDLICCCCSRGWNYPGLNHSQPQPDIRIAKNCTTA